MQTPSRQTAEARLRACITEGWRIVRDPLLRVSELDHVAHLTDAAQEACAWLPLLSDQGSPLVDDLWALHGALWDMFLHITGDDGVW